MLCSSFNSKEDKTDHICIIANYLGYEHNPSNMSQQKEKL
jgi:hypothetical protein